MDNAILDAFFEECEDLLTALADGLSDMREGATDSETVNAVFRAVHSIKGAAGAFAMEALVGFAHTFETVLDEVRANKLDPSDDLWSGCCNLRRLRRATHCQGMRRRTARTPDQPHWPALLEAARKRTRAA